MAKRTVRLLAGWAVGSLAGFALAPVEAKAFGEIFRIDTTGTEYCGDLDATQFGGRIAVPLWVQLDSDTQITVSLTPNFAPGTAFPMAGFFYLTNNGSAESSSNPRASDMGSWMGACDDGRASPRLQDPTTGSRGLPQFLASACTITRPT